MAATLRLYGKKCIVNGCKTVQVAAGNGPTMRTFPWGNGALLWQRILTLERAGTHWKTVTRSTRISMDHFEEPRVHGWLINPFRSQMKRTIHLAILWREILPISICNISSVKWDLWLLNIDLQL